MLRALAIAMALASPAAAATLGPYVDPETGRPFFTVAGDECWTGKWHGEPIDCALIDLIENETRPRTRPCEPFYGSCERATGRERLSPIYLALAQSQAQAQRQTVHTGGSTLTLISGGSTSFSGGDTFLSEFSITTVNFFKDCPPDEPITETPYPSPVPLPAGVWLLLSAVGLLAWRKKA